MTTLKVCLFIFNLKTLSDSLNYRLIVYLTLQLKKVSLSKFLLKSVERLHDFFLIWGKWKFVKKDCQLFETHSFTNTLGMACSLKKHVKTMHEDGNSYIIDTCPVCSKHFKYKTALETHMKKVHQSSLPNEPQEYRLV